MVKSHLNPDISYEEPIDIHVDDVNHDSDVYELEILGKNVEIVLGREKTKDDISYYNVYLVVKSGSMRPVTFKNQGITSISADTHKYGNCFKGSSVLLFSHPSIKKHQHFVKTDWEGGMYATPTLLGSKSGALIASTWGSLIYTGTKKLTQDF